MNERTNEQTNERTNEGTNERTKERTNEQTKERTHPVGLNSLIHCVEDGALLEEHPVTGEGARLVGEEVPHLAQLFVQVGRPSLSSHIRLRVIHLKVLIMGRAQTFEDKENVHLDSLKHDQSTFKPATVHMTRPLGIHKCTVWRRQQKLSKTSMENFPISATDRHKYRRLQSTCTFVAAFPRTVPCLHMLKV